MPTLEPSASIIYKSGGPFRPLTNVMRRPSGLIAGFVFVVPRPAVDLRGAPPMRLAEKTSEPFSPSRAYSSELPSVENTGVRNVTFRAGGTIVRARAVTRSNNTRCDVCPELETPYV